MQLEEESKLERGPVLHEPSYREDGDEVTGQRFQHYRSFRQWCYPWLVLGEIGWKRVVRDEVEQNVGDGHGGEGGGGGRRMLGEEADFNSH